LINQRLNKIEKLFLNSIQTKELIIKDKLFNSLTVMGELATNSIINGGKIMLCGNGGSAADAQHLAAELTVRLKPMNNREGIAAISLAQDASTITACGNDFGFDFLYERLIKSLGNDGDCLIGITTSGNSKKRYSCDEGSQKNEY
jgi:D-sedoheptulose 7-phosphate isomerase